MIVLGISGLYHDSAAAILKDGQIAAAAQEERFTRVKHDNSLPFHAIDYCLGCVGKKMFEIDKVVYYDQPLLTLERFLANATEYHIEKRLTELISQRIMVDKNLRRRYGVLGKNDELLTVEHHMSHAASAFYPSPFSHAATLTIDGVGEWATTTIGSGSGKELRLIKEIDYPHSLGLMYSAFTSFCGFKVNSGDYKFMGLAPYGEPVYCDLIREKLIDIRPDGSFTLNLDYFDYHRGAYMTNDSFAALFGGPAREPESRITRREMNIAASAQKVTEELILLLAREAHRLTGESNLVMAGGVALNCVANGRLLREGPFENIWLQPAAGDAGGALGCALYAWYQDPASRRDDPTDTMNGSYLGPEFTNEEIIRTLDEQGAAYHRLEVGELLKRTAKLLDEGNVVGWFQGRMEFGPRALGHRSILADPRSSGMQSKMNLKIKYRESFRPFAPSVLIDDCEKYFELQSESPYMLLCADVQKDRRREFDKEAFLNEFDDDMLPIVNAPRSDIPAVTHIDYSARIQTVSRERNGSYYDLINEFKRQTGCGVLVNTSFNVRGEPIVCTPRDAWLCFMRTEMDALVVGDLLLLKEEQKEWYEEIDWREQYGLD